MALRSVLGRRAGRAIEPDRRDPEAWRAVDPTVTAIAALAPRVEASVVAEIVSVRLVPKLDRSPWIEATVSDGTGRMVLMWTGRRSIPGIGPGRLVRASGRPAATGPGGRLVLLNPDYELR